MFRRFSAAAAASSIWFQSAFFGQTELGAPVECGRAICALMTDFTFGVAGCRNHAEKCLGDFLSPSPPAEKATARQDQTGKSCTGDGAGNGGTSIKLRNNDVPRISNDI
jgi:hypothetical protein